MRHAEVTNGSTAPMDVTAYADAASIQESGFVVADGHATNDVTTWTRVQPSSFRLPPGGVQRLTLTVTVPADAPDGEQYGVVLADSTGTGGASEVALRSRVGIRMYLSIGKGSEPPSSFTIDTLTATRTATKVPLVRAKVHNTGGRALDLTGSLRLSHGPGGLSAGPFPVQNLRTLAIGASGDVAVPLDPQLPAGPWLARIDLSSGRVKSSAQGTITFPDQGEAPPVPAKLVEDKHDQLPWLAIAIGAALLFGLLLLLLLLLKRRSRPEDRRDEVVTVTPAPPG